MAPARATAKAARATAKAAAAAKARANSTQKLRARATAKESRKAKAKARLAEKAPAKTKAHITIETLCYACSFVGYVYVLQTNDNMIKMFKWFVRYAHVLTTHEFAP